MERVGVTLPYAAVEDVHPLHFCYVFVKEDLGWNATARSVEDIHSRKSKVLGGEDGMLPPSRSKPYIRIGLRVGGKGLQRYRKDD